MRRQPAPARIRSLADVTVITTYSTETIDMALLWNFMAQVEKTCQERRAKSRPENKTQRKQVARIQETQ